MLVLTRKSGEKIIIGDNVVVSVLDVNGSQVKLGIQAPRSVTVHRSEIYQKIQEENRLAAAVEGADISAADNLWAPVKGTSPSSGEIKA